MDPVTHGLMGASASLSFAKKEKMSYAALAGTGGAMLPDLDILINSASDPLLQLEFHRQFSHSFFFIPVGALIVAGLIWWLVRKQLTFKETYLFSFLGILTAGLADTITSYGVQLLWPFTDERFAWNLISVFDPLFSLVIFIGVIAALYNNNRLYACLAFAWIFLYLLFGWTQQKRAETVAHNLSEKRNHSIEQLIVKPTIANELLWSVRYVSGDSLYADGVHLLPFAGANIYEGESAKLLNWKERYSHLQGTTIYNEIGRFSELSDGILVNHPDSSHIIGDGRYAMLPTSIKPLWGIEIDTTNPKQHVDFNTYRDANADVRQGFMNMLFGKDVQ